MNSTLRNVLALASVVIATQATAAITFYENEGFRGRSFVTEKNLANFKFHGFNNRASSVVVWNYRWEVCEDARFKGHCVVLRPGRYPSLAAMGLNDRVSSVRAVAGNMRIDDRRYAPPPTPVYDYRRRQNERLFEAQVTSVRAVVGPPNQRCWLERERVELNHRGDANIPGAIVGAIIGGILGHQIGDGRGQDIATAGGVVAGAAVGANVGRDNDSAYGRDIRRCRKVPSQAYPEYWDVTYDFRGEEHRVQMTTPPGNSVTVNEYGEPRE